MASTTDNVALPDTEGRKYLLAEIERDSADIAHLLWVNTEERYKEAVRERLIPKLRTEDDDTSPITDLKHDAHFVAELLAELRGGEAPVWLIPSFKAGRL
jgi:hypothetical protein